MKFFKSYTFEWWQMGIFKIALLSIGVALGVYAYEFFRVNLYAVLVLALVSGLYSLYISLKQVH